jgi:hypothetical protein
LTRPVGAPYSSPADASTSHHSSPSNGPVDARTLGLLIVALGFVLVLVGALVAVGALGWVGRLPGDFRIEGGRSRIYIPLTSMILLSVLLTLLITLLRRFL